LLNPPGDHMRQKLLVILVLVALTLAAHWRVIECEFVNYDDNDYVTANPIVQKGLTKDGLVWAWGQLHGEKTYWHPITWMSHMVDCQLFGLKAAGHHGMNLLFHGINVVLLFLVLERMTGARWRSALVAALWAVHPINVDTVAWVSERKNVLSAMFWLMAMAAYARYAAKPGIGRYGLVFLAMALGLMCKPVLVTLPCALLLLDFWPLSRWRPKTWAESGGAHAQPFAPASLTLLCVEKLPLLALSAVSGFVTLWGHDVLGMREDLYNLTTRLKIENALVSIVRYIDNLFWPAKLTVLYMHPGAWPPWKIALCAFVVFAITGIAIWRVRSRPYLLVGWLWFLGVMLPFLGLRQAGMQAMADRFAYLPMLGLLVMIVWTAADLVAGRPMKALVPSAAAASACIATLLVMSINQTAHWRNSIALWEWALSIDENNRVAHHSLAVEYTNVKQLERARRHAIEAVRQRSEFIEPRILLGLISLLEQKPEEAAQHFEMALRARNDAPGVFIKTAESVALNGDLAGGIAMHFAYLKLFPAVLNVRSRLAAMLTAAGRTAEADRLYRDLIPLQQDNPEVLNDFAWLLATAADPAVRNGAEAVRHAERACELTGRKQAGYIGTLAAAYAEAGRFEDATRAAQQAIDVATSAGEKERADINRQLLELYRAGEPFRQGQAR
jgi:Tfp pilus assembly protein PilF